MIKKISMVFVLVLKILIAQPYDVGDVVENFSGDICYNGEGLWSYDNQGTNKVTWLSFMRSWDPSSASAAPQTEVILQEYINDPLVLVVFGQDWNQPYSCSSWGSTFGLSYPIVDDINDIYGLFGAGYIPHNVIISGDGEVLYSDSGYNQTAIINIINQALESTSNCYNPNQILGDLDNDGQLTILDINILNSFFFSGSEAGECFQEVADINNDETINIIDLINLLNLVFSDD